MKNLSNIRVDEANLLTGQGLIVPDIPPQDKGALRIEINFPAEHPFKPSKITLKQRLSSQQWWKRAGLKRINFSVISAESWKPATKTDQVSSPS